MSNIGDIQVSVNSLSDLIVVLRNDNKQICNIIKNVTDSVNKLDETKWKTPEKEKMNEILLPYLEKININMENFLNECTDLLEKANISYNRTDEDMASNASNLGS